jgi:hypothetical protein
MRFLIFLFGLVFSFNAYPVTIEEIKNKRYDDFWEEIKAGGKITMDTHLKNNNGHPP